MLETVTVPPQPYPTGLLWWFRNGDSWHAPLINNGVPYLPTISNQFIRDFFWFCRNPIGNFMGFVIGFAGTGYTATGPAPVMLTTWYDAVPPQYGFKWAFLNLWAPFVSYSGKYVLWYLGWRPYSGGFGFKFNLHV
jgi:hypothetical protein